MCKTLKVEAIENLARQIRTLSLAMIFLAQSGHPGGCLSVADMLAYLWHTRLPYGFPGDTSLIGNRMILSKGHSVPALYAAAFTSGLISWPELASFRKLGSKLQGHPHVGDFEWLETSTGSLGQGLSVATGLALGEKMRNSPSFTYAVCGDGEMQEGQVWEAAMFASHHQLSRLTVLVDRNRFQSDMETEDVMGLEPLEEKWRAFGWRVESVNGHDFAALENGIRNLESDEAQPGILIANTTKGKGVSWMEGQGEWHGSVAMTEAQIESALFELGTDPGWVREHLFMNGVGDG